ncbi:MAG: hypothetical protein WKG00_28415 [Polyangiaceae bacterium]
MMWLVLGTTAVAFAFIWWRSTSIRRGALARDERILEVLDPIGKALQAGASVSEDEVARLAAQPELRVLLRTLLQQFDRLSLFPARFDTAEAQGEGLLAYWMLHPNELDAAPVEVAHEASVARTVDDQAATFHVYRYRMPPRHWAGKEWLFGLAGPFFEGEAPYSGRAGAFSRAGDKHAAVVGDSATSVTPEALVDRYLELMRDARR